MAFGMAHWYGRNVTTPFCCMPCQQLTLPTSSIAMFIVTWMVTVHTLRRHMAIISITKRHHTVLPKLLPVLEVLTISLLKIMTTPWIAVTLFFKSRFKHTRAQKKLLRNLNKLSRNSFNSELMMNLTKKFEKISLTRNEHKRWFWRKLNRSSELMSLFGNFWVTTKVSKKARVLKQQLLLLPGIFWILKEHSCLSGSKEKISTNKSFFFLKLFSLSRNGKSEKEDINHFDIKTLHWVEKNNFCAH
jgi:hypothetical protein